MSDRRTYSSALLSRRPSALRQRPALRELFGKIDVRSLFADKDALEDQDTRLFRAVAELELFAETKEAAQTLERAETRPVSLWLMLQLSIHEADAALTRWQNAASTTTAERARVGLLRALLGLEREGLAEGGGLGRIALALLDEDWQTFVSLLGNDDAQVLLAAHVQGDVLGDRSAQLELLRSTNGGEPLVTEVLLERALGGEADISEALQRQARSSDEAGNVHVAAAAELYRAIACGAALPARTLTEQQERLAWQHLQHLLQRRDGATKPELLEQTYRLLASAAGGEQADALRLRATELALARHDFGAALETLPTGNLAQPPLEALAHYYRFMALLRQGDGAEAARWLLEREDADVDTLAAALALAMRSQQLSAQLLDRVHARLRELHVPPTDPARALLFAAARSAGYQDQLTTYWCDLIDDSSETAAQPFIAFGAACRLVASAQGRKRDAILQRAAVALSLAQTRDNSICRALSAFLAAAHEDWSRAQKEIETLASTATQANAAALWQIAAEIAWTTGNPSRAAELMDLALAADASKAAAMRYLASIQFEMGDLAAAAATLDAAIQTVDEGPQLCDLRCAVGELALQLDDLERAEGALQAALEVNPLSPEALRSLRRLYSKSQDFAKLVPLLVSSLSIAESDSARFELHLELATVLRRQLEAGSRDNRLAEMLLTHGGHALDLQPKHLSALRNFLSACQALESWPTLVAHATALRQSVAGLEGLQQAMRQLEDWQGLATVSLELADAATDAGKSYDAAVEAGDAFAEHLRDNAAAERCYQQAALLAPERAEAWRRLAGLLRKDPSRSADLGTCLEKLLDIIDDDGALALRLELGKLQAEVLNQPEKAKKLFHAALDQVPGHSQALRALGDLVQEEGLPADRVRVLEQLLKKSRAAEDQLTLLLQIGTAYRELDDERAVRGVAAQLEAHAGSPLALKFIETTFVEQDRPRDLREFYRRRIEAMDPDADELTDLLRRKGDLELSQPEMNAEACETFARLLGLRPHDTELRDRIVRILAGAADWQRLVSIFERQADVLADPQERVEYLRRAATIAQDQLHDEAETVRLNERILHLAPSDAAAFAVLEKRLERQDDYKRLVDLFLAQAKSASGENEEKMYLLRAATVCEKTDRVAEAIELYQRVGTIDPTDSTAVAALARIYEALERWEELLTITKHQIALGGNASAIALLHFRCGSIMETKYHDDVAALQHYTRALRNYRAFQPALHGVRDIYTRAGNWGKVVETLEQEAALWSDAKGQASILAQAAEVTANKIGDKERALELYKAVIRKNPGSLRAARFLFDHHLENQRYREAATWGEICAERGRNLTSSFYVDWAHVLKKLGQPAKAAAVLIKALKRTPGHKGALYGLLALARVYPNDYDFVSVFQTLIADAAERDDEEAAAILSSAAGVVAEQHGNVAEALQLYRQGIERLGLRLGLVIPLADLLVALGEANDARELVAKGREETEAPPERLEATLWLARHWRFQPDGLPKADAYYREALALFPANNESRVEWAGVLSFAGEHQAAQTCLEEACNQAASHGEDVEQLAKYHHALGLAAYKAGNRRAAESSWRRACELYPDWPYPYLALSRHLELAGDLANAEREIKLANQGIDVLYADVFRSQAEFYSRQGHGSRAATLYRKAQKCGDALIDDRINEARFIDAPQAVALLRQIIAEQPHSIAAYQQLVTSSMAGGDSDLAYRASQVVSLATGTHDPSATPTRLRALSEGAESWLGSAVSHPIFAEVWTAIQEHVSSPAQTQGEKMSRVVAAACREVSGPLEISFDVQLHDVERRPLWASGQTVFLSNLSSKIGDMRPALAAGALALKLGVGPLVGLSAEERRSLATLMADIVAAESRLEAATAIVAQLPARQKKQIVRLTRESTPEQRTAVEAETWLGLVDQTVWLGALMMCENLHDLSLALAIRHGVDPAWPAGGLHTLRPIASLSASYISAHFDNVCRGKQNLDQV